MADLEMFRGNDRVFQLAITRNEQPLDISGGVLRFVARETVAEDAPILISKDTTTADMVITDPPNGQVDLFINSADTVDLYAPAALPFDVELVDNGDVSTVAQGILLLKRAVIPA